MKKRLVHYLKAALIVDDCSFILINIVNKNLFGKSKLKILYFTQSPLLPFFKEVCGGIFLFTASCLVNDNLFKFYLIEFVYQT